VKPLEVAAQSEDHLTKESMSDPYKTWSVPAQPAPILAALPRVTDYDVVAELGQGGMGIVYKVFDRRRGRMAAMKTLPGFASAALYRFKQEFRTLAEVTHPNLITLYDLISDGQQWFFTMELIEGGNFREYLRANDTRTEGAEPTAEPFDRLRDALRQLAEGVSALHDAGKLHRDLKPGNVLVTPQGRVVILDFGLAAELDPAGLYASTQRHLAGTVPYMSPEQVACQPLSAASDWYSVGVMLYEALSGRLPFEGTAFEILRAKQETEPEPLSHLVTNLPEDLEALCMELLRRRPESRPTGRDIVERLRGAAPALTPMRSPANTGTPFFSRREQLAALHEAFAATRQGQTRTVLIHGSSGMGKSALVRHFLDTLSRQEQVVVLTGRCYERESVPYKALDSLVDALSRYLRHLPQAEALAVLPRDAALLRRVFPVLGCVAAVSAAPQRNLNLPTAQELRRRAFTALRELLARLGDRWPLILFIDDLQWGDTDSGLLLAELVRPPDAPVLLLLGSYRSEESETSPCVQALRATQDRLGIAPDRCDIAVEALSLAEAGDLARVLLGASVPAEQVETIARESGGSPLFVQELVQYLQAGNERETLGTKSQPVTLDQMLWERIQRLATDDRQFLEIVAVAGRPLCQSLARQAAELETDERAVVARLRAGGLIRVTGSAEREEIETYHDRVRETVTAHLPPATLALHHRRLAQALESSGQTDAELLAVHLLEGGELARAGVCYARAGQQAADALAFDRAARLYRCSLDLRTVDGAEERQLRIHLAETLANAGRGAESARQYLQAASEADEAEALDLRRRAALRFLTCGHYQEGRQVLPSLLSAIGLKLPSSPERALASLLLHRLKLRLRGLRFTLRPGEQIDPKDIRYIDICWAVGVGLFAVDLLAASLFLTRGLLRALAVGDSFRIARALALEASFLISQGGRRRCRRAAEAVDIADRLARQGEHPSAQGLVLLTRGMIAYSEGRWQDACDLYDRAETVYREHGLGVAFEINLARYYSLFAHYYRGDINAIAQRSVILYQEARERDDFLATMMVGLVKLYGRLSADDIDAVRRELGEIVEHCPEQGVELLRHNVWIWQINLELYCGNGTAALQLLNQPRSALERSLVQRSRHLRIPWQYKRGCCFLAAAAEAFDRKSLEKSAEEAARTLEREKLPWANGLAGLLRAGVAVCRDERERASAILREALATFEATGMFLYAAAARRRLGELIGGDEGRRRIEQADAWMAEQKIRNPTRMTALYAPGFVAGRE
jgi:serine/threonine protein kinase